MKTESTPPAQVSPQMEEYLEAICRIRDRRALAGPTELARELGVAPPSVLGMRLRLEKPGLIAYARSTGATLTKRGSARAAGLWHLFREGLITPVQVLVAAVTFTLFLPCIAQFLMMKKELGLKATLLMSIFIVIVAFGVGYLLRVGLETSGIHLILNRQAVALSP